MDREKDAVRCRPRSKRTVYGMSNCKSQIAKLKSEIWESEIPSEARSCHRPIACDRRGLLLVHSSVTNLS